MPSRNPSAIPRDRPPPGHGRGRAGRLGVLISVAAAIRRGRSGRDRRTKTPTSAVNRGLPNKLAATPPMMMPRSSKRASSRCTAARGANRGAIPSEDVMSERSLASPIAPRQASHFRLIRKIAPDLLPGTRWRSTAASARPPKQISAPEAQRLLRLASDPYIPLLHVSPWFSCQTELRQSFLRRSAVQSPAAGAIVLFQQ